MSAVIDQHPAKRAASVLAPGLLLLAVLLAVAALALRGSSRVAQQPCGQLSVQAATGELVAGSRAGQTFRVDQSGLYRIDVYLGNGQRQNQGPVVLHVTAAPFGGPDLARATADASQLQIDGFVAFQFAPLSEPAGQPLAFWLEAPEAGPGHAPTVMGATQDLYPGGAAVFDNLSATHGVQDLAFKLYFQSELLGSLAVVLARQAAGRPGIFGWPQLYLALLLAYLLGLAVLLGLAARRLWL
jgi:hypothetical protein